MHTSLDSIPSGYLDALSSQHIKTKTSYGTIKGFQKADPYTLNPHINHIVTGLGRRAHLAKLRDKQLSIMRIRRRRRRIRRRRKGRRRRMRTNQQLEQKINPQ